MLGYTMKAGWLGFFFHGVSNEETYCGFVATSPTQNQDRGRLEGR